MTQKRTHARGNPRKPSKKKKSSLGDIQDPDPVWTPVDLVICGKGFVKNEKEQYGQYDSLRELINNHYDSGATRVDITIGKNEIEIRGNGHPIEDYDVLRRVFTDIKRENKVITDIDGNSRVMIGEKGRGRFSFVSTANELFIESKFGQFNLELTEDQDVKATIKNRKNGESSPNGTVCVLRSTSENHDFRKSAQSIKDYIMKNFGFFSGTNLEIYIDGQKLPMQEFKPQSRAWLIVGIGSYLERMLPTADPDQVIYTVDYDTDVSAAIVFDKNHVDSIKSEPSNAVVREFEIMFTRVDGSSLEKGEVTNLSQLIPIKITVPVNFSTFFGLKAAINSDLSLEPSRKNYASVELSAACPRYLEAADIDKILEEALVFSLGHYVEENYLDFGWDTYDMPERTASILSHGWRIKIPKLEVEVKYHFDHSVRDRIMTIEELASSDLPVVLFTENAASEIRREADLLIQKGHFGIELPSTSSTYSTQLFLNYNGVKCVVPKIPEKPSEPEITDIGARSDAESLLLHRAGSFIENFCLSPICSEVEFDIATHRNEDWAAVFQAPSSIIFNRANPHIQEMIEKIEAAESISEEPIATLYLDMLVSKIVISELAHYLVSKKSVSRSLEHSETILAEKDLQSHVLSVLTEILDVYKEHPLLRPKK